MKNFKFLFALGLLFAAASCDVHAAPPPAEDHQDCLTLSAGNLTDFTIEATSFVIEAPAFCMAEHRTPVIPSFALAADIHYLDLPRAPAAGPRQRVGSYNYVRDISSELDSKMHPAERLRL